MGNGLSRIERRKQDDSFGLPAVQVAGFAVLFAALLVLSFLFPGHLGLIFGLALAAGFAGKLVVEQLGADENDQLPPASREFRQLADPRRPLAADDPVTIPRGETGTDTGALPPGTPRPGNGV